MIFKLFMESLFSSNAISEKKPSVSTIKWSGHYFIFVVIWFYILPFRNGIFEENKINPTFLEEKNYIL